MTQQQQRRNGRGLAAAMAVIAITVGAPLRADDGAADPAAGVTMAPSAISGTASPKTARAAADRPVDVAGAVADVLKVLDKDGATPAAADADAAAVLPVEPLAAPAATPPTAPAAEEAVVEVAPAAVAEVAPVYSDRVSLSFAEGASIDEVLTAFSLQTGKGIVLGPEVTGQVMLRLRNTPWEEALQVILEPYGYGYKAVGDTIVVNKLEQRALTEALEPLVSRVFTLKYLDAFGVKDMIEAQLSPRGRLTTLTIRGQRGWEYDSGGKGAIGGSGADSGKRVRKEEDDRQREIERQRSRMIVVVDIASVLTRIEALLDQVDRMPVQVLIEARFVEVDHGVLQDLGVQFGTGRGGATSEGPTPVTLTTGSSLVGVGVQQTGGSTAPSAFAPSSLELSNKQPFNAGLTLLFQKLDPTQFEVMLHMLEEDAYLNVLSAPRILTLNNEEATIMVGTKYPIIRTDVSGDTGSTSTSIDYWQDIGIQLNVVPQICEREHIRMVIHPAVTSQIGTVSGRTISNANSTGGGTTVPSTDYPVLSTRETETQIILRSGEMLAIGGLLKDEERNTEFKVPFLGDIPLLGRLFRRKTTTKKKLDLVIFLTATIVPPDEPVTVAESPAMRTLRDERAQTEAATLKTEAAMANIDERTVVDTGMAVKTEAQALDSADRTAVSEQARGEVAGQTKAAVKALDMAPLAVPSEPTQPDMTEPAEPAAPAAAAPAVATRTTLSEQDKRDEAWQKEERTKEELIQRLQAQRAAFVETLRSLETGTPVSDEPPADRGAAETAIDAAATPETVAPEMTPEDVPAVTPATDVMPGASVEVEDPAPPKPVREAQ